MIDGQKWRYSIVKVYVDDMNTIVLLSRTIVIYINRMLYTIYIGKGSYINSFKNDKAMRI